ncbi:hypothetical protein F5887DRAFT_1195513 [Amanita rubescens]|nr:hypothetical protein F5887DRAFT_1195513 [Amanita rubescens]
MQSRTLKITDPAVITPYLLATPLTMDVSESFINSDLEALLLFGWRATSGKTETSVELSPLRMGSDFSSSKAPSEIPELAISQKLRASLRPSDSVDFQTVDHHFFVQGPNGSHLFLIFPLAGPSIIRKNVVGHLDPIISTYV